MQHCKTLLVAAIAYVAASLTSLPADARPEPVSSNEIASLLVQAHPGAEAIDVSGHGSSGQVLTVTLVSTLDRDLPDVVLSRTSLKADASGVFTGAISIAPGFTRGSIITVYVTSFGSSSAATARYLPDAPNRGVVIPLDNVPRSVR
jgi:hypothetical protein